MDRFTLYNQPISSNTLSFQKNKEFLNNKFLIMFHSIHNSLKSANPTHNIIDSIYDSILNHTPAYSIESLFQDIFCKHTSLNLKYTTTILEDLQQEIKNHCIISCLYTLSSISNANKYILLTKLAKKFSAKSYIMTDSTNKENLFVIDYNSGDSEKCQLLYSNWDSLFTATHDYTNFFNASIDLVKDNSHRNVNSFLQEFSLDLIINQMSGGYHLDTKYSALLRSKLHTTDENRRKQTKKFVNDLNYININFNPIDNTDSIMNLLYYWKKENLFHINAIKYLINDCINFDLQLADAILALPVVLSLKPFNDLIQLNNSISTEHLKFLFKYISEIIIPIYSHSLFIVMCEHFNYSIDDIIKELHSYIHKHNIAFPNHTTDRIYIDDIKTSKKDIICKCILDNYLFRVSATPFDDSFSISIEPIGLNEFDLYHYQSTISLAYYNQIIK